MAVTVTNLRERVRRLHGMEELLPALAGLPRSYLVGGAVRDLLLGARPADLDLAVVGDAASVARAVGAALEPGGAEHGRFGTAVVRDDPDLNFAMTRRETYAHPGALPEVEEAPLSEDLARRDFAINAMAIGLTGDDLGHLYDPHDGVADLKAGDVRVLHDASFIDDPTRLLRALRYEARLGFAMEPDTERLAIAAIEGEALGTLSGVRIGDQLVGRGEPRGAHGGLLGEERVARAVRRMRGLELDHALHPDLEADPELVASAALGAVTIGSDRALAGPRRPVQRAPRRSSTSGSPTSACRRPAATPSHAPRAWDPGSRPSCATAPTRRPSWPRCCAASRPRRWRWPSRCRRRPTTCCAGSGELRDVRLEITGDDLTAAGVPEGPRLGRALEGTLALKLDGLVHTRDEELEHALRLAGEES